MNIVGKIETEGVFLPKFKFSFLAQGTLFRKPMIENPMEVGYIKEGDVPMVTKSNYREGEVIFIDDFNHHILPSLDFFVKSVEAELKKFEQDIFDSFIKSMMTNKKLRIIIKDAIKNMEFTEHTTGSAL